MAIMSDATALLPEVAQVKAIRGFNRFYTRRIGVLDPYRDSDMSLTDVRVLYELAHRAEAVASEIGRDRSRRPPPGRYRHLRSS